MKKSILLLVITLAAIVAQAAEKPSMIGRRGCSYAVENSREAFERGADLGFDMMECHVRVTADSVYVAAHDGKTARLGGNMKIASSPAAELLTETYTQKIGDAVYTGRLMTIADYLDFCRDRKLTPLLHLKTMGRNDSDTAPLRGLMELIDSKGLRGETVVITSSKAYTDCFLNDYPGLKVVFQADGKWRELLPWILERRLDVDIKSDFIDASTVSAFHDAGLRIMTWTVNDIAEYQRLRDLGVDQMITDNLSPLTLP